MYFEFGLDLATKFELGNFEFALLNGLAKGHYLTNNVKEGDKLAQQALVAAKNNSEKIEVLRLQQDFYEAFTLYNESIVAGIEILNLLNLPTKKSVIGKDNELDQLIEGEYQALMNNLKKENALETSFGQWMVNTPDMDQMNVLANMITSAAHVDKKLYSWVVLKMSNHTFNRGLSDASPFALVHLGSLLIQEYGAYPLGIKICKLGWKFMDQVQSDKYVNRTILCYYDLVGHLKEPYTSIQERLENRVSQLMKTGDFLTINALCRISVRNQLLSGNALIKTIDNCEEALEAMPSGYNECFGAQLVIIKQNLAKLLREGGQEIETSASEAIDLLRKKKCFFILSEQYVFKSLIHCLIGDYKKALNYLNENEEFIVLATSQPQVARQRILKAICELMLGTSPKKEIAKDLQKLQKSLEPWSNGVPENFRAEHELIEYLICICKADYQTAVLKLEEGIKWSEKGGLISIKALLCDLGSKLMPKDSFGFLAKYLKQEKRQIYKDWTASIKAENLDGSPETHNLQDKTTPVNFDTQSLLKATQAISAEVNLGSLVQQLLNIVMENAGADKGALILIKNEIPYLESIVNTNSEKTSSFSEIELQESDQLPVNLIEHVISTSKELSLDDIKKTNYPEESYFRKNIISSLVILPLLKQKDLVGVLYLENRQVKGLFTEGDLEILRIIASQAAISITNTMLYEQSTALNQELSSSQEELAK